jgi:predicted amidohydrolase YtcJ
VTSYVLRRAATAPGVLSDLAIVDGRFATRAPGDAEIVDLGGRPTLPGLCDHHIHLMAQAAAWRSVDCSPAALADGLGLAATLRAARQRQPRGWLRGVAYDVTASGSLDRVVLDTIDVGPVRIQDRTGTLWMLDTAALAETLPASDLDRPDGVERDASGSPTGVLRRLDGWLRSRLAPDDPDLAEVGRWLAARGVTSLTDATATNGPDELALLATSGLPQKITAMTAAASWPAVEGVARGPVKIVLDEADLPDLDTLGRRVDDAHGRGRSVAFHCVDSGSLMLALACDIGPGDRIEHASLVSEDHLVLLARCGVTVVVQPGLVSTRGDRYLAETDRRDHPSLHRLGSLLAAGIPVRVSSDAPFGPIDPWTAVAAAVDRTTASGVAFGPGEAIDPGTALGLMTTGATNARLVERGPVGGCADLLVLDDDWDSLGRHPSVALTMVDGASVYSVLDTLRVNRI